MTSHSENLKSKSLSRKTRREERERERERESAEELAVVVVVKTVERRRKGVIFGHVRTLTLCLERLEANTEQEFPKKPKQNKKTEQTCQRPDQQDQCRTSVICV